MKTSQVTVLGLLAHFDNNSVVPTHRVTGAESQYQPVWEPSALCPAHVPTGWGTPLPVAVGSRADARDATDARDSPPPRPPCHTGITGMPPAVTRARGPASPPHQAHFRQQPSRRLPSGRQLLRRCRHSGPCHPGSSLQFAPSPGPHLSARRWRPNLKVGVLADFNFISY